MRQTFSSQSSGDKNTVNILLRLNFNKKKYKQCHCLFTLMVSLSEANSVLLYCHFKTTTTRLECTLMRIYEKQFVVVCVAHRSRSRVICGQMQCRSNVESWMSLDMSEYTADITCWKLVYWETGSSGRRCGNLTECLWRYLRNMFSHVPVQETYCISCQ